MFANSFQTSDVLGSTFAAATMGCFATAALMALGLTWVSERWRIPVALAAVALAISALAYMSAEELWLSGGKLSSAPRFAAWFAVHPLLVAAVYFFVSIAGSVPAGVFWRITVAALLMVLSRAILVTRTSSIRLSGSCFRSPSGSTFSVRCISAEWLT